MDVELAIQDEVAHFEVGIDKVLFAVGVERVGHHRQTRQLHQLSQPAGAGPVPSDCPRSDLGHSGRRSYR